MPAPPIRRSQRQQGSCGDRRRSWRSSDDPPLPVGYHSRQNAEVGSIARHVHLAPRARKANPRSGPDVCRARSGDTLRVAAVADNGRAAACTIDPARLNRSAAPGASDLIWAASPVGRRAASAAPSNVSDTKRCRRCSHRPIKLLGRAKVTLRFRTAENGTRSQRRCAKAQVHNVRAFGHDAARRCRRANTRPRADQRSGPTEIADRTVQLSPTAMAAVEPPPTSRTDDPRAARAGVPSSIVAPCRFTSQTILTPRGAAVPRRPADMHHPPRVER